MKRSPRMIIATLFAAGPAIALAQADPAAAPSAPAPAPAATTTPAPAPAPKAAAPAAPTPVKPAPAYVQEPVASASRDSGPNADAANAIVQALNADPSMKPSKITVQAEEGGILLTGVTSTNAQRERALAMATQHAGEGKVSNALTSEELVVTKGEEPRPEGVNQAAGRPPQEEQQGQGQLQGQR